MKNDEGKERRKMYFVNVYFFMEPKSSKKERKHFGVYEMEIPGFYDGIFIKYLYKLYKGKIYISFNVSTPLGKFFFGTH